jgi:alkylation response protein AidB-like acyl-CoA dehydrogenase
MDFRLSAEQEEFRRTVARFVDAEVAPVAHAIDEAGEFPRALSGAWASRDTSVSATPRPSAGPMPTS